MRYNVSLPAHVPEQIAVYQTDHLITQDVCQFDPQQAAFRLQAPQDVMAIDLGGDKLRKATYAIRNGKLAKRDEDEIQSRGGAGYLAFLERLAEEAIAKDLRVGISSATKLNGSVVSRTVNLPVFFQELTQRYGADYENLFPGRSFVANDTITGLCGASTLLALQGRKIEDVAFFICGSGMGASVIKVGMAIHVEAAHVPLVESLNPLGQTTPCGVEGKEYVCLERVTAARAGIEDLYLQQTGEARDGVTLGRMYEQGDSLSTVLYETSARALSHAVVGAMNRYAFAETGESVVVFHGGNFEIELYRDEVRRSLEQLPGFHAQAVFARDLSKNVCLDGAALLAVYTDFG
ncbi:MAG: ROK family protein [Chloroflexota bacterium]|nr:ROK family protein [Chloroflexota bacterium]